MMHKDLLQCHNCGVFLGPCFVDLTNPPVSKSLMSKGNANGLPECSFSELANKFIVANIRTARKPELTVTMLLQGHGHARPLTRVDWIGSVTANPGVFGSISRRVTSHVIVEWLVKEAIDACYVCSF
jgi:hypothetical protein